MLLSLVRATVQLIDCFGWFLCSITCCALDVPIKCSPYYKFQLHFLKNINFSLCIAHCFHVPRLEHFRFLFPFPYQYHYTASAMEYSWSICSIDAHSKICGSACETARYFYSAVLPGPFSRTLLIELIYNRSKLALSCLQYRLTSMLMWDQAAFGFVR